jgi:hypothetical protein
MATRWFSTLLTVVTSSTVMVLLMMSLPVHSTATCTKNNKRLSKKCARWPWCRSHTQEAHRSHAAPAHCPHQPTGATQPPLTGPTAATPLSLETRMRPRPPLSLHKDGGNQHPTSGMSCCPRRRRYGDSSREGWARALQYLRQRAGRPQQKPHQEKKRRGWGTESATRVADRRVGQAVSVGRTPINHTAPRTRWDTGGGGVGVRRVHWPTPPPR